MTRGFELTACSLSSRVAVAQDTEPLGERSGIGIFYKTRLSIEPRSAAAIRFVMYILLTEGQGGNELILSSSGRLPKSTSFGKVLFLFIDDSATTFLRVSLKSSSSPIHSIDPRSAPL